MKGSRGEANLVTKCKMCSRESSIGEYNFRIKHHFSLFLSIFNFQIFYQALFQNIQSMIQTRLNQ